MKKAVIVTLVCLNLGLLAGLIFGTTTQRADAQVVGGGTDYLMVTGNIGSDWDAVYVIDLGKRRLAAWRFDKTNKRLVGYRGRELMRDFRRKK